LYANDQIDKIRSEKNRGKIQIGQWCYEINVGTTDDASALITATNQGKIEKDKFVLLFYSLQPHRRVHQQIHLH
jgi:hypothetical protein